MHEGLNRSAGYGKSDRCITIKVQWCIVDVYKIGLLGVDRRLVGASLEVTELDGSTFDRTVIEVVAISVNMSQTSTSDILYYLRYI